jgi:hypothetical protein
MESTIMEFLTRQQKSITDEFQKLSTQLKELESKKKFFDEMIISLDELNSMPLPKINLPKLDLPEVVTSKLQNNLKTQLPLNIVNLSDALMKLANRRKFLVAEELADRLRLKFPKLYTEDSLERINSLINDWLTNKQKMPKGLKIAVSDSQEYRGKLGIMLGGRTWKPCLTERGKKVIVTLMTKGKPQQKMTSQDITSMCATTFPLWASRCNEFGSSVRSELDNLAKLIEAKQITYLKYILLSSRERVFYFEDTRQFPRYIHTLAKQLNL